MKEQECSALPHRLDSERHRPNGLLLLSNSLIRTLELFFQRHRRIRHVARVVRLVEERVEIYLRTALILARSWEAATELQQ